MTYNDTPLPDPRPGLGLILPCTHAPARLPPPSPLRRRNLARGHRPATSAGLRPAVRATRKPAGRALYDSHQGRVPASAGPRYPRWYSRIVRRCCKLRGSLLYRGLAAKPARLFILAAHPRAADSRARATGTTAKFAAWMVVPASVSRSAPAKSSAERKRHAAVSRRGFVERPQNS